MASEQPRTRNEFTGAMINLVFKSLARGDTACSGEMCYWRIPDRATLCAVVTEALEDRTSRLI